ncbi:tetratricopeptide repeat protein [Flavobacterium sp. ZT3R18]|uniref:tetratricopeptide repeat-containing sensor histidine kinase n=1 Tax=Flavobacterium sp. ZT3R18 TaxID=2594429 RepID=UPI00117AA28A|nr:ATP-binding protein [Flavobacterium sp. ZT3R18]TRX37468.1 tetratricopeptide repeat protein [Flavobacterium sp. ZT3R18]
MKKYILFFLILSINFSFSQKSKQKEIDSLEIELSHAKEDTLKVKILDHLSALNFYLDSNLSFKHAKSALLLSQKLRYKKGTAYAYNNIGIYYLLKSDFPKALNYVFKALKIHEDRNNKYGIASSSNALGTIYVEFKNYKLALSCYNKALKTSKEIKDQESIATYLNNIGDVYLKMKKYPKALFYFNKALITNGIRKNSFESGLNYTNIGITNNYLKQYEKSIKATTKSILINKNDPSLFNGFNKIELGKSYYFLALEEQNKLKKEKLLQKSIDYINEAMLLFTKHKSLIDIRDAYLYLSKIKKAQGKHEDALYFFEKNTYLNDSIFSNKNKIQIALLESKREIELRDKKIEIQDLKIKNASRKVYLLITISIGILILLALFLWLYLSKRKTNQLLNDKNKIISTINSQKDKFFSIIAHDLRDPFNGFLGLSELLAEDLDNMTKEEIQFAAVSMKSSATNLFQLLENLLEWSRMEQGLIPFAPQEKLVVSIVAECMTTIQEAANNKNISINIEISEKTTVFADNNSIHSVIRNLVSNAVKFTPERGTISIKAKEDDKKTTISITDTGIGMSAKMVENLFRLDVETNRNGTNDEPSTGLGLILCKEFVEKHGGEIWVESEEEKGTTFNISFPNKKYSSI